MASVPTREQLELELNDFDPDRRRAALDGLLEEVAQGLIALPAPRPAVNLHAHTFFSYNGYGYSPTCFAWKARLDGLTAAGTVDFDVLDAVDEFLEASRRLNLKACCGIETRVFLPEFADREISSPGEPGIAYHMGSGFTSTRAGLEDYLAGMKEAAQRRNRAILERVNPHLAPAELDYERDVLPLTPNGNATERHLCMAYDVKAAELFPNPEARAQFWADRLGEPPERIRAALGSAPELQGLIRTKTMKRGGVGYVQPEGPDFPRLDEVNAFIRAEGAIPTFAWLDGTSPGEQALDELFDLHQAHGAAAVNIIPDRNWNLKDPEQRRVKVAKLYEFVEAADRRHMPILVGTEMNAYGQRFVDDFEADAMKPLWPLFLKGAHILYAHTALQCMLGLGYLSEWAATNFPTVPDKNAFYEEVGAKLPPAAWAQLESLPASPRPEEILAIVRVL
jgi:hypothetical protein